MTSLSWSTFGTRFYENGVDRGVLYMSGQPGVAWVGLTSVTENPSGGSPTPYYVDGVKYLNVPTAEEYAATITAFTYPDEFSLCDGSAQPRPGLYVAQQRRQLFGFSYRTMVGNDLAGNSAYKIHLVYNAYAAPTQRDNDSDSDTANPNEFSWAITTVPPSTPGYDYSSHIVIDSRTTDSIVLSTLEEILYGTDTTSPRLPAFAELVSTYDSPTLVVTDNGDGTFTITGPEQAITMLDASDFQITWDTAIFVDDNTWTISS